MSADLPSQFQVPSIPFILSISAAGFMSGIPPMSPPFFSMAGVAAAAGDIAAVAAGAAANAELETHEHITTKPIFLIIENTLRLVLRNESPGIAGRIFTAIAGCLATQLLQFFPAREEALELRVDRFEPRL